MLFLYWSVKDTLGGEHLKLGLFRLAKRPVLWVSGIDDSSIIENENQRNVFSFTLYQPCLVEKF